MDDDDDEDDDDEEELPEVSVTKKKSERQLELEQGDDYKIGEKNTMGVLGGGQRGACPSWISKKCLWGY